MKLKMKKHYRDYLRIFDDNIKWCWCLGLVIFLLTVPVYAGDYLMYILCTAGIYVIVSVGLNILTGFSGQISLGHVAFFSSGAYTSAILTSKCGLMFWAAMPLAGIVAALVGLIVAIPCLRLSGMYLGIATLAFAYILDEVILQWQSLTNGSNGYVVPPVTIGQYSIREGNFFYIVLFTAIILIIAAKNIFRMTTGKAIIAVRDSEIGAETAGISPAKAKITAFLISAFYTGVAGSLFAHYLEFIGPEMFTIVESILFLSMIIVGGIGTIAGSVVGAVFMTFLPEVLNFIGDFLPESFGQIEAAFQSMMYGVVLVLFLLFEPRGLYGRWVKMRYYWELFPYYRKGTFKRERKFYRKENK